MAISLLHFYHTFSLSFAPHILAPVAQLLFFSLPPFPHRPLLFTSTMVGLAVPCLTPHPDEAEGTTQWRYGMAAMWLYYLGGVGKMLFHQPEFEFWRLRKEKREAMTMRGCSWQKVCWAAELLTCWRGLGWNWEVRSLPPRPQLVGKGQFVLQRMKEMLGYYLVLDAATTFLMRQHFRNPGDTMARYGLGMKSLLVLAVGSQSFFALRFQYATWCCMLVGLGLSSEQDYSPLMGDIRQVVSLRTFWGRFWHQNLRSTFTDYGRALAEFLGVRPRTKASLLVQTWNAFFLSALFHAIPAWSLRPTPPFNSFYERFCLLFIFFMLQAVGVTLEDILLQRVQMNAWAKSKPKLLEWGGRLWTFGWLWYTGLYGVECWLKTEQGMMDMPFRITEAVGKRIGIL